MSTLLAAYVLAGDDPRTTFERVCALLAASAAPPCTVHLHPASPWVAIHLEGEELPASIPANLSRDLGTEVVGLAAQTTVEAFMYRHHVRGEEVRSLVHGCLEEATWEECSGSPRPWEADVLFPPGELERLSETLGEEDRELVTRVYQDREVAVGTGWPMMDAGRVTLGVATALGLPGFTPELTLDPEAAGQLARRIAVAP